MKITNKNAYKKAKKFYRTIIKPEIKRAKKNGKKKVMVCDFRLPEFSNFTSYYICKILEKKGYKVYRDMYHTYTMYW
jgi:hypothetical protein